MSELLSAAAAALGTPEALVKRAAEARAAATGSSVDEVLAAWAGGAPVAAPPAQADVEPASEPAAAPEPAESESVAPPIAVPAAPTAPPPATTIGPYKPPILVGAVDNPWAILTGVLGLFFIVLLVGLIGPALPAENPGARTSQLPFSAEAEKGQHLYTQLGCAACHTQMVRPVVADVGLGVVTLNDTNQVLGTRRFGPDLSDVGSRADAGEIEAVIGGSGGHLRHSLSQGDMSLLVAYLVESRTSAGDG